ncbi:hypothetical protein QJQ45_025928 [Haematococcus lacustris]|nr:hypothetical protein QJQ45_025928 [Haematococcus lacustris]
MTEQLLMVQMPQIFHVYHTCTQLQSPSSQFGSHLALPAAFMAMLSPTIAQRFQCSWQYIKRTTRVASRVATIHGPLVTSRPTQNGQLEAKLDMLHANKQKWANMPLPGKVEILQEILARSVDKTRSLGLAAAELRGQATNESLASADMVATSLVLGSYIPALIDSLQAMHTTGRCLTLPTRTLPNGQQVVKVYPHTETDQRLASSLLAGVTAELYIQPGKPATQGAALQAGKGGKVAALLGAGNHGFLGLKDVLYMLFECNNVVVFKPHPLQAKWHAVAEHILEPLSRRGFYTSLACDSVEETQQLVYHPAVEAVHMTGGTATHDAIVWGADPEEQARRKAANDPVLKVPMSSELGCVTPWIVTPGRWSLEELKAHAQNIAAGIVINNSCNCNSLKVLVLPADWEQADELLSQVKEVLRQEPLAPAFYPGIKQRYEAWREAATAPEVLHAPLLPATRDFGTAPLPVLVQEVPFPEEGQELTPQQRYAFTVEPFAPVLSVVRVPAASTPDYLAKTTKFCNRQVWGTLSCSVLLHPDTQRDWPQQAEQMLHDLEYGTVMVNTWSAIAYPIPHVVWGAFAGQQTLADVGSGMGQINNTHFFDYPQKAVVRVPFDWALLAKPPSAQPIPLLLAQALSGFAVHGWWGIPKGLFASQ